MVKKIIVLCISIIVTIAGTLFLGYYDFKVYYSPQGDNADIYNTRYREYLRSNLVDVVNNSDYVNQSREVINLYRNIHGYYYEEEPIYRQQVVVEGKELFWIDVYYDVIQYSPTATDTYEKEAMEVYIYSVNYDNIKELYMDPTVLPGSKTKVEKAAYPTLIVNFYPNEDYVAEEALIYSSSGATISFTLPTGEKIYGSKLNSNLSFAIFDYNSTPRFTESNEPYLVQYLLLREYSSNVNIVDEGDDVVTNNRDRFLDGAYVKIDALLEVEGIYYDYDVTPDDNKIEELPFATADINHDNLVQGFESDIEKINIKGLKTFKQFIFTKYVWWQCLIAFVVLGVIMTFFYITFTYEGKKDRNAKKPTSKK